MNENGFSDNVCKDEEWLSDLYDAMHLNEIEKPDEQTLDALADNIVIHYQLRQRLRPRADRLAKHLPKCRSIKQILFGLLAEGQRVGVSRCRLYLGRNGFAEGTSGIHLSSIESVGYSPSDSRRLECGALATRRHVSHESYRCFENNGPTVFKVNPTLDEPVDGSVSGLPLQWLPHHPCKHFLEDSSEVWLEIPIFDDQGQPVGKLSCELQTIPESASRLEEFANLVALVAPRIRSQYQQQIDSQLGDATTLFDLATTKRELFTASHRMISQLFEGCAVECFVPRVDSYGFYKIVPGFGSACADQLTQELCQTGDSFYLHDTSDSNLTNMQAVGLRSFPKGFRTFLSTTFRYRGQHAIITVRKSDTDGRLGFEEWKQRVVKRIGLALGHKLEQLDLETSRHRARKCRQALRDSAFLSGDQSVRRVFRSMFNRGKCEPFLAFVRRTNCIRFLQTHVSEKYSRETLDRCCLRISEFVEGRNETVFVADLSRLVDGAGVPQYAIGCAVLFRGRKLGTLCLFSDGRLSQNDMSAFEELAARYAEIEMVKVFEALHESIRSPEIAGCASDFMAELEETVSLALEYHASSSEVSIHGTRVLCGAERAIRAVAYYSIRTFHLLNRPIGLTWRRDGNTVFMTLSGVSLRNPAVTCPRMEKKIKEVVGHSVQIQFHHSTGLQATIDVREKSWSGFGLGAILV